VTRGAGDDRYRQMWEGTLAVMLLIDPVSLEILDANPAAAAFYGHPLEVLRTMRMTDINTLADEEFLEQVASVADGGRGPFLFRHRLASGEIRDVQVLASQLTVDGRVCNLEIVNDMTPELVAVERARRSERRFQTLVEHMPAISYAQSPDADPEVFYVSPQTEQVFGFPPALWFDPGFWESRVHPDDLERVLVEDARTNATGDGFSMDYRFLTADGRTLWVRDRADLVTDADGRPMWQGFIQDITEQKEAEERFQRLVEALPAVTYTYVEDTPGSGTYQHGYLSPQVEAMTGVPREEFFGDGVALWRDLLDPRDADGLRARDAEAEATGEMFHSEYRLRTRDGRLRWIRDQSSLFRDEPGRRREWLGVMFDVTDAKESDERFRRLVEQLPAVTYLYREAEESGAQGKLVYVSPQVEPMLGYPLERWLEHDLLAEIIDPRDLERVRTIQERAAATGEVFRAEFRVRAADDREVWIAVESMVSVATPVGARERLGVVFDITDRKRADDDLRHSFDLLRVADTERRQLLSRIVEAQEAERRKIAADIHDDPIQKMTAVGLRLETLARYLHEPEGLAQLDVLRETVTGAIARLRHLLFELHPPALERDGLSAALRDTLHQLELDDEVETHLEDRLVDEPSDDVRAVAYRIAQEALMNVSKHAGATRIDVLLEGRSDGVVLRVRDDGSGFSRGAVTRAGHLGIPAMRERAEMIGGRVRIESVPGRGTTVEAWLPDLRSSMVRPA
jgi:PAS domain S-box-containing protein